ncbi:MAG: prepilin-type N-terminal cleavage/methylation domain-containing protein [Candidatus Sericytochromatia bacterium]|nr:prepilin-type N-terminal cleavage/methylation domain-containing protein [Candidatus Sericytochromatia bacterium]
MKNTVQKRQHGFTLIELLFSITILLIVMALVTNMIINTTKTQDRLRMENQMRQTLQTGLFRIAAQLNQNRMLVQADALGYDYLTHVNLSGSPPIIGGSLPTSSGVTNQTLLPTIRPEGSLSPEKNCTDYPTNFFRANAVGNILMFAKYTGKFNRFSMAAITEKRSLDVYEFKLYYITDDANQPEKSPIDFWNNTPSKRRLRLIEWTSRPYVDYAQFLDYITDSSPANRTIIRSDLTSAGISFAFNRSASTYATAFYTMGSLASVPADASHMIQRSRIKDMFLFGTQSFSIAYNKNDNTASANYFPIRQQVPFFYDHAPPACNGAVPAPNTTPNSSTTAFPYGFEVMITGPASGRNVLMRVSSVARSYNSFVSHADMLTTYARDL